MGSLRYTCDFGGCTFITDRLHEVEAHVAETGHPSPLGASLPELVAWVQEVCGSDGHIASRKTPGVCGVCGAPIPKKDTGRFLCRAPGCDFASDDAGELEVHDVSTHGLVEVRPVQADKLRQLLADELCTRSGHIPNPINPTACLVCGAPLEVLRG